MKETNQGIKLPYRQPTLTAFGTMKELTHQSAGSYNAGSGNDLASNDGIFSANPNDRLQDQHNMSANDPSFDGFNV